MKFDEFTLWERRERARRIDFAMRDFTNAMYFGEFSEEDLKTPEVKAKIRERLTIPSKMGKFLHAASLIRKHPKQWRMYLANPSRRLPKVFDSFADDKLLIFYLFFCEKVKIFHLDPAYPFFICNQVDACTYVANGEADDDLFIIEPIIEMWISMGSPWKESHWGTKLSRMAEMLKKCSAMKRNRDSIMIG